MSADNKGNFRYTTDDLKVVQQPSQAPKPTTTQQVPTPPGSPPSGSNPVPYAPPNPPNGGNVQNTTEPKKGRWWKRLLVSAVAILIVLFLIGTPTLDSSASVLNSIGSRISSGFDKVLSWIGIGDESPEDIGLGNLVDLPIEWRCVVNSDTKLVSYDPQVRNHIASLKFSDSFGVPIEGLAPEDGVWKHFGWNCIDPYQVVANAYVLARVPVGDGILADDLPWLAPFRGDPMRQVDGGEKGYITEMQSYVYKFFPTWGIPNPTEEQNKAYREGNLLFQELAGRINMTLARFEVGEIKRPVSTFTVGVAGNGLVYSAGSVPALEVSESEDREAIMLYTKPKKADKEDKCDRTTLALNIHDQRLEIVEPCKEAPPAKAAPKPQGPPSVHQGPPPVAPPPSGPPPVGPPPVNPPGPNCTTHPVPECFPVNPPGKQGPVRVEPGAPPAVVSEPPSDPDVPLNPYTPGPESLPSAPITGDPGTNDGAAAPGATPIEADVDRGVDGSAPAPVDSAAETPPDSAGIGDSSDPDA